jgi:hypothetical protein
LLKKDIDDEKIHNNKKGNMKESGACQEDPEKKGKST